MPVATAIITIITTAMATATLMDGPNLGGEKQSGLRIGAGGRVRCLHGSGSRQGSSQERNSHHR